MNIKHLIIKNILWYKPFYRLIAIAVMVAVAVITGSLAVGDSVRNTLVKRVEERLGKTETVIFSRYSYLDDTIIEALCENSLHLCGKKTFEPDSQKVYTGILLLNGFLSVSGNLIPVTIWGTNDMNIEKGQAKINTALYNEIKSSQPKDIVLRLPAAGMIPLGSMFVTDSYTTSLRLKLEEVISVEQSGNLNLKNEQTIPFNIFVNREELSETMEVQGKINLILSDQIISKDQFAAAWNYIHSGLKINGNGKPNPQILSKTVTSDRIFIQNKVVETFYKQDSTTNRIYSYFANSISTQYVIPYSFITAVDYYNGQVLKPNEIILSDYTAKRLNVTLNDTVLVKYFVLNHLKTLVEDSVYLTLSKIVSVEDLQGDKTLVAEFPGLSNVESCTDWNSDLPINMSLITKEDEKYWEKYKNTPKAIVSYSAFAPRWKNAFGSATALQICDISKLEDLNYEMFDIQLFYPRETGIIAAKSGVDFSTLFLSLGIFIIISAAFLMLVPLSEMLFCRQGEIELLKATGFSSKRILKLFWRESIPIVLGSAIIGVMAGLAYTYLVLFLLGNVWKGATHTEGFGVYPNLMTLVIGVMIGIVFSLVLLYVSLVRSLKAKKTLTTKAKKNRLKTPFNSNKLIGASLFYNRKQAILSFITLSSGVFILFSVGLNRQGFADSSQIRAATGGFSLWCETVVPIYHNIQTDEGRAKLGLQDLKEVEALHVIPLLKYSADDASCLNLNKVVTPNVIGIDMEELKNSDFKVVKTIFNEPSVFEKLKTKNYSLYPALIDETVLTWSLGKNLGDTLVYLGEKGDTVSILLAGVIQNSIFQGYILIDKDLFSEIWSEISGSEIMLLKLPEQEIAHTKMLISQALNPYGIRVMTTGERMKMFYSVTDTYLTIFLTLGGLGLLLGIFGFIIVVRKNLVARKNEIMLYRSLGFDEKRIVNLLYQENIIVPLSAILTGVLGSLTVVSAGFSHVSNGVWGGVLIFLIIFIVAVVIFVKKSIQYKVYKNKK